MLHLAKQEQDLQDLQDLQDWGSVQGKLCFILQICLNLGNPARFLHPPIGK